MSWSCHTFYETQEKALHCVQSSLKSQALLRFSLFHPYFCDDQNLYTSTLKRCSKHTWCFCHKVSNVNLPKIVHVSYVLFQSGRTYTYINCIIGMFELVQMTPWPKNRPCPSNHHCHMYDFYFHLLLWLVVRNMDSTSWTTSHIISALAGWGFVKSSHIPNKVCNILIWFLDFLQVPYLVDPNTCVSMAESKDIIAYLFKTYGASSSKPVAAWPVSDNVDVESLVRKLVVKKHIELCPETNYVRSSSGSQLRI